MSASTHRYCQCGTRLARDHTGVLCGSCASQAFRQRAAPPDVPASFWDTQQFGDAFAAHHMGRVARAYRRHPHQLARFGKDGISQELHGQWLGLTQAQVSRIENGPPMRNLDTLTHWARVLRIPSRLLWFKLPADEATWGTATRIRTGSVRSPATVMVQAPPLDLKPVGDTGPSGRDMATMQAFRAADLQVGGGHLYASVISYLQTDVAPRLFGSDHETDNRAVFTAAAALTEMAGWMAHDAGRDKRAKQPSAGPWRWYRSVVSGSSAPTSSAA